METELPFRDRRAAGEALARELRERAPADPVVLALPRGGVPVAAPVARALDAPLDVLVVRKVGAPGQPELGVGALAEGGDVELDGTALRRLRLSARDLEPTIRAERRECERRVARYRGGREPVSLAGRDVVLVDDGLATGVSARAALRAARQRGAASVWLAVPVGSPRAVEELAAAADEVVCLHAPASFMAVGEAYVDFAQTTDDEVNRLLAAAPQRVQPSGRPDEV